MIRKIVTSKISREPVQRAIAALIAALCGLGVAWAVIPRVPETISTLQAAAVIVCIGLSLRWIVRRFSSN